MMALSVLMMVSPELMMMMVSVLKAASEIEFYLNKNYLPKRVVILEFVLISL